MKNIKIGDRLLCKKSLFNSSMTYFYAREYYTINEIQSESDGEYSYYIIDNNGYTMPFSFNNNTLYAYFYTKQEMRHMKLKKIYEETES